MTDSAQQVYFAKCIGPTGEPIGAYKIGCSHGWKDRVKSVTANLPFTLEVEAVTPGGLVMERIVHIMMKKRRIAGEYFHDHSDIHGLIAKINRSGRAFDRITDLASCNLPDGTIQNFMKYHGVTLSDACKTIGKSLAYYEKRSPRTAFKSNVVTAAVAITAYRRGQYVEWPTDAIRGFLGDVAPGCTVSMEAAE